MNPTSIRYIDGHRLRLALIAGSQRLIESKGYLNKINVFPVPDGDTGTNMAGTVHSLLTGIAGMREPSVSSVSKAAADAALMGAKGNSGAILAQFFVGLAEELREDIKITTEAFGHAVHKAVYKAYEALSSPKEGTILTVLKDWASGVTQAAGKTEDFRVLMKETLAFARVSLEKTMHIRPEMKKAGVVDAGAQGFVDLLEGIVGFITKGSLRSVSKLKVEAFEEGESHQFELDGDLEYRYCTECVISLKPEQKVDRHQIMHFLEGMGDSVIVAGTDTRLKIHLHTNDPSRSFEYLSDFGAFEGQKVDDMEMQAQAARNKNTRPVLLVDSSCDMPDTMRDELNIDMVPVRVIINGQSWLDHFALSHATFYKWKRERPDLEISTSQPASVDFARKMEYLAEGHGEVLYFGLSNALSGTLNAGRLAASSDNLKDRVTVVDSRSISVSEGLIARRLALALEQGASVAEAAELAESLIDRTKLFVTVPDIAGLVKSGRVSPVKGSIAGFLKLKPIIGLDETGKANQEGMYRGDTGKEAVLKKIQKCIPAGASADFAICQAEAEEDALWMKQQLESLYRCEHDVYIVPAAPALIAHAGLGALGVAVILPEGA